MATKHTSGTRLNQTLGTVSSKERISVHAACLGLGAALAAGTLGCSAGIGADAPSDGIESGLGFARATPSRELGPRTRFFVPPAQPGAVKQFGELLRARHFRDAARIAALATTPQASWFNGGSPDEVREQVRETMRAADREQRVPVLVAYNIPFRDCSQYSGGGAVDTAAYEAWIDGFARGIGRGKAVVILEPDGLGIIPYNTTLFGASDWCKPVVTDAAGNSVPAPGASPEARYAELQYAVASLESRAPSASVYLDGTHSAWLGVGEAAYRIYKAGFKAGVQQVQGFFVNVSNFQPTAELTQFGTWVSMCLAAGTPGVGPDWMRDPVTGLPHFEWCPAQYDPATNYTTVNYTPEFAAGVTAAIQGLMGGAEASTRFVIDTGRNGVGPWTPAPSASYPDAQVWCNPPGRGLGLRPTANTGAALASAYLWIKTPGGSDGSCNRGIGGSTTDPEWGGIVDPAAGDWFPAQALELARLATPPLF